MRLHVLSLLILLVVPLIAGETQIHSDTYYSGDSFTVTIDGKEEINYISYFVYDRNNDSNNKLYWKKGTQGFTITVDNCKVETFYKYCFDDVDWKDTSEGGTLKYRHGDEYPGLKLSIYKIGTELTISRTSTEGTSLNLFQETQIETKITNNGDRKADDIVYQEFPPSTINVYGVSAIYTLDPVDKYLHWKGFLYPGEFVALKYKVKPVTYDPFSVPGLLSFSYKGIVTNITVPTLAFTITTPFTFTSAISSATGKLYDVTTLSATCSNSDKYRDMHALIRFSIPKELDVLSKSPGFTKDGDYYVFSQIISPEKSSIAMEMDMRGGSTGTYNMTVYGEFTFGEEHYLQKYSHTYQITATTLTPNIRLIDSSVEGGTKVRLVAEMKNMDTVQDLRNIKATISGPLLPEPIKIDDALLERDKLIKYVDQYLTTPITNTKLEYTFWYNGTYLLASDEEHNFSSFAVLTINPAGGDHFDITKEFSQENVTRGKNITIKTYVKNQKDYNAFKVDIEDTFPAGTKVVAGAKRNTLDLEGQEKKQAYLYLLDVPSDFLDSNLTIKTKIRFQEYTVEKEFMIPVIAPLNDTILPVNITINDTTNFTTPINDTTSDDKTIVVTKTENFIVRFFNWLKKLF